MRNGHPDQEERRQQPQDVPATEWAAALIGVIIISAALIALLYEGAGRSASPPQIRISVLSVEPRERGYLVQMRVANTGTSTAAQLVVEGTLIPGVGQEENRQITIDYVPGGSERRAGLFFTSDPNKGQLEIVAVGYQDP